MPAVETRSTVESTTADFERFIAEPAIAKCDWLMPMRQAAIARFAQLGFPTMRHEEWQFTNIAPIANTAFRLSGVGAALVEGDEVVEADVLADLLADITAWDDGCLRLVFVDGRFSAEHSRLGEMPDGLTACGLADALESHRPIVEAHLGRYADYKDEVFTAWNTAFQSDGAFIHVARGTVVETPIHVVFITTRSDEAVVTHPRNLIVCESQSQVTIVESTIGPKDAIYLTNTVTEIVAGESAVVDHYRVERESQAAYHKSALHIHQERTANVSSHVTNLGGRIVRNDVEVVLGAEGCECTLNGLTAIGDDQHVDNHLRINHDKPHGNSWEFYKGVYDGRARGVFSGRILVAKDAQKTDAKQSNMSLLLSGEALVDSKPQLEILADDVKCTHGATIGQIDEDAIFYLRSRGIGKEAARSLLVYAFAGESLGQIRIEPLRDQLQKLLFERLPHGDLLSFGRPYEYDRNFGQVVRSTDRRREH